MLHGMSTHSGGVPTRLFQATFGPSSSPVEAGLHNAKIIARIEAVLLAALLLDKDGK
jgi:hypothetical protein